MIFVDKKTYFLDNTGEAQAKIGTFKSTNNLGEV